MEKNNQLAIIVKESKLEPSKAKYILEQFQDYFEIAAEWEVKAKNIVVTKETQTTDMEMARTGRLFLKEKRVAVEKARKKLKEQALREGKAIDGIANVLKALIIPIEEHLNKQENFVKIKEEEKREALRVEAERKMEEERIAKEKAEAEEQARIRAENEKLRKEAEAREERLANERRIHDESIAKERAKADAERKAIEDKARKEREAAEQKARKAKEEQEKKLADERAKAEAKRKKAEAKAEAERREKERLAELLKNQITCPKCKHKFQLEDGKCQK
jgi:hypothetical protein